MNSNRNTCWAIPPGSLTVVAFQKHHFFNINIAFQALSHYNVRIHSFPCPRPPCQQRHLTFWTPYCEKSALVTRRSAVNKLVNVIRAESACLLSDSEVKKTNMKIIIFHGLFEMAMKLSQVSEKGWFLLTQRFTEAQNCTITGWKNVAIFRW